MGLVRDLMELPSGKRLHNYGKSSFLTGKLTISMAMFNTYLKLPQGIQKFNLQPANRYFVISTTALVWVTQKKSWGVLPFCDTSEIWSSWMGNCREYPTCLPKSVILRSENVFFPATVHTVPTVQRCTIPEALQENDRWSTAAGYGQWPFQELIDWMYLPCMGPVYGLCKRISPQNVVLYGAVMCCTSILGSWNSYWYGVCHDPSDSGRTWMLLPQVPSPKSQLMVINGISSWFNGTTLW